MFERYNGMSMISSKEVNDDKMNIFLFFILWMLLDILKTSVFDRRVMETGWVRENTCDCYCLVRHYDLYHQLFNYIVGDFGCRVTS